MMFASLLMVGFISYTEPLHGGMILLIGTLFGWMVIPGGWAVYAIFFYLYAFFKFASKNPPVIAINVMLILALMTFFLSVCHMVQDAVPFTLGAGERSFGF